MTALSSGVPSLADYDRLLATDLFRQLRTAADRFLDEHGDLLAPYRRRWVSDPLHQWSRQWEYPYAWERVASLARGQRERMRVLDAGSGITFFPYTMNASLGVEVVCVDGDDSLGAIHHVLRERTGASVKFVSADLRRLPQPDNYFDVIYCLSVLEHTRGYPEILLELRRVLRPGGTLVVSFDLSLDGDSDIPLDIAAQLTETLTNVFPSGDMPDSKSLPVTARAREALTTLTIAERDRTLLPWPHPLVCVARALRRGRVPKRLGYTNLTFTCFTMM
jgi:2-polyprenyl-3-methyl-5-hydroxy-6-metoxy-1,4-benzoquinol methylase